MIRSITIKARDITGAAITNYDGIDNLSYFLFQEVFGPSFSGDGITYQIDRNISSITISSERLNGNLDIVRDGLQLYLNAGDTESYPGSGTTWYDGSINSYDTTLTNGVGYSSDSGGTLTFDGINDYVDTNQPLSSESFSVGAWFKLTASGINMILSKETSAGNPWNYRIWINSGTIVADMAVGVVQSSLTSPLNIYNDGNWYYVMFTRNDNNWYLYVNGQQVATKVDNLTGSVANSQELWIGRSAYLGGSYAYNGKISSVFVYGRVLSTSEILHNYNATKSRFGL